MLARIPPTAKADIAAGSLIDAAGAVAAVVPDGGGGTVRVLLEGRRGPDSRALALLIAGREAA